MMILIKSVEASFGEKKMGGEDFILSAGIESVNLRRKEA